MSIKEGFAHEYYKEIENVIKYFGLTFSYLTLDVNLDGTVDYKVPIKYIRTSKIYSSFKSEMDKIRNVMPLLTYDVVNLSYLSHIHNNSLQTQKKFDYNYNNEGELFFKAPYRISINLKIICIKLSHLYQILEQILPHFTPTLTTSPITEFVNLEPAWAKYPITLNSINFLPRKDEEYPSYLEDLHIAELSFSVDTMLYSRLKGRVSRQKIEEIVLRYYEKFSLDTETVMNQDWNEVL